MSQLKKQGIHSLVYVSFAVAVLGFLAAPGTARADQVILDDLIVDGSICVGQDCVNGESFGFDTIRLKENNLRIRAVDTSNTSNFPTRDWQLTFNDSTNGGADKFSIDDIDGGRTPFTIEGNAPSHSLYVDDGGRIGLGTSTPVTDIHVKSGNTPTLRLEQDGTSGFTPQTWDLASNETNIFIRDATNGSTLPFRIRPGAPTSSIDVAGDGDVGLGTSSPGNTLHMRRTDGTASILVEEANGTAEQRGLLELRNNGGAFIHLSNTDSGNDWFLTSEHTLPRRFIISSSATAGPQFAMDISGNLVLQGTVTAPSDRNLKHNITDVDSQQILSKVVEMPISEWSYKANNPELRHIGPMAQDFYAAFGLNDDEKKIVISDMSGVALAAIKGLNENLTERDERIRGLEARLKQLEALVLEE